MTKEAELPGAVTLAANEFMRSLLKAFPDSRETVERAGAFLKVEVAGRPEYFFLVAFPPMPKPR